MCFLLYPIFTSWVYTLVLLRAHPQINKETYHLNTIPRKEFFVCLFIVVVEVYRLVPNAAWSRLSSSRSDQQRTQACRSKMKACPPQQVVSQPDPHQSL